MKPEQGCLISCVHCHIPRPIASYERGGKIHFRTCQKCRNLYRYLPFSERGKSEAVAEVSQGRYLAEMGYRWMFLHHYDYAEFAESCWPDNWEDFQVKWGFIGNTAKVEIEDNGGLSVTRILGAWQ